MSILAQMEAYIAEHQLCTQADRILIGLSGGKDSVLLLHLLQEAGYSLGIAHAHFGLRADDADQDETLAKAYAQQFQLPYFVKHFSTLSFAQQEGISIQMAARDLRYAWFEEIRQQQHFDYIATAHHANDHVETFLLNLVRGMGLKGLRGILPKRDQIIRPLLFATAEQVQEEVTKRQLHYRDDLSNFSTKYARNKIRLEVMPHLIDINPQATTNMQKSIGFLQASIAWVSAFVEGWRQKEFVPTPWGGYRIALEAYTQMEQPEVTDVLLWQPYGFTASVLQNLRQSIGHGRVGALFMSETHVINLDRDALLLMPKQRDLPAVIMPVDQPKGEMHWGAYRLQWERTTAHPHNFEPNSFYFDAKALQGPLRIRAWQREDRMQPLGMKGRSKKMSDIWVSMKIPHYLKSQIPLLETRQGEIVACIGYRSSEPYKIQADTSEVLKITYVYNDER